MRLFLLPTRASTRADEVMWAYQIVMLAGKRRRKGAVDPDHGAYGLQPCLLTLTGDGLARAYEGCVLAVQGELRKGQAYACPQEAEDANGCQGGDTNITLFREEDLLASAARCRSYDRDEQRLVAWLRRSRNVLAGADTHEKSAVRAALLEAFPSREWKDPSLVELLAYPAVYYTGEPTAIFILPDDKDSASHHQFPAKYMRAVKWVQSITWSSHNG